MARFKTTLAPDLLIRVGEDAIRFAGGIYETENPSHITALRANPAVVEDVPAESAPGEGEGEGKGKGKGGK